jgi:hypothetical protein
MIVPKEFTEMLPYGLSNLPTEPPDDPTALSTSPDFTKSSRYSRLRNIKPDIERKFQRVHAWCTPAGEPRYQIEHSET